MSANAQRGQQMQFKHYDYSTKATLASQIEKAVKDQRLAERLGDVEKATTIRERRARLEIQLQDADGIETVTRILRPFQHIVEAEGGDTITLDASELRHPPIAEVLWTQEEAAEAQRKFEALHKRESPKFLWRPDMNAQARQMLDAANQESQKRRDAISSSMDEQLARAAGKREEAAVKERMRFPVSRGGGDK